MCLLQSWYVLSDYEVEDRINDSLSFSYFCGMTIEQVAPDHFGFKKHHVTDDEGIVVGVLTTTASKNGIAILEEVLDTVNIELPEDIPLKADKGYQSKKNVEVLKKRKLKNHILKKALKNKLLTKWELRFTKLIGKTRFKVERTFGGIKLWFKGGIARYKGMGKMHTQNLMEAICYNLYRSHGIVASNIKK
ncbi:Mobile element protein [hydrothermal vent metagenome]|uniref:Mobile element protein n=1 Tax=hydrothermal vent metagenome TaxID=652676 RepID=A0A3B0SZY8_9ZZZZ